MKKINLGITSEGLLNTVKDNNDEIGGTTVDLHYGMTPEAFKNAINTNDKVYANESDYPNVTYNTTSEGFLDLFNTAVEGGVKTIFILTVNKTPADATVAVTLSGTLISAEADGTYKLEDKKTYVLTVSKVGYVASTESITVNNADITKDITLVALSSEKEVLTFSVADQSADLTIDNVNYIITGTITNGSSLVNQVTTFTLSEDAMAKVGETALVSGDVIDYTNPVTLTIVAEDTSIQDYTVTITEAGA